jgi:hypothetical protein
MEYRDPNSETQTTTSHINFYPAKLHAGIAPDQGREGGKILRYKVVVLDLKGNPLAGTNAKVTLLNRGKYFP